MEKNNTAFYEFVKKQSLQWELVDAELAHLDDENCKPLPPKKIKEKVIYEKTHSNRI